MSIPLTIDWLTLTWLKLRLGLWWKARRSLGSSRRQLALVLWTVVLSGCVPVTRFEETQSAAQVEMAGRHRAELQLKELEEENAALLSRLREKDAELSQRGDALAQAELDKSTEGKERADAESLVEQLRSELARVGGHLQAYHADKQQLEVALQGEAARGRALSLLTRDVALSLHEPLATGEYELDAPERRVVLRVGRDALLAADGTLAPAARELAKAIERVLSLHPTSKLRVEDTLAPGDPLAASRVVAALGLPQERIEPLADSEVAAPAGPAAILFSFSVP